MTLMINLIHHKISGKEAYYRVFGGIFFTDVTVRLDADPAYFVGVSVYDVDMWGRVCSTFWDDNDANVALPPW